MDSETPGTLHLVLPDWSGLDTVRRHPLPFALWTIGDQSLLFHWFDHAVNRGYEGVKIQVTDRPAEVRKALETATLWPIRMEVISSGNASGPAGDSQVVTGLPDHPEVRLPANGWELLDHAAALEQEWLNRFYKDPNSDLLAIGSACKIHPNVKLVPPYFIGDDVFVGPGCEVGPHAVIGSGSLLAGANQVIRSQIAPHTFLGPVTGLEDCLLEGGVLFNRRHRARIDRLETHLSSSLQADARQTPPPLAERLLALRLAWRLRGARRTLSGETPTYEGKVLPGLQIDELATRLAWLRLVWKGEMRLFGVLPRSPAQMNALPDDWRSAIEHAPTGVFSYADCHGCHSPEDPDEALHATYQAGVPAATLLPILKAFVLKLLPTGFPA
ncbi:MAG: hypothetical protein JWO82_555 [Akkermansiaceae bacterium]|nr:hypothetical protein [Akkermansiaceae bacterium]